MSDSIVLTEPSLEVVEVPSETIIVVAPSVEILELEGSTTIEVVESNFVLELIEPDPLEIIHAGAIGPEGPSGVAEDEIMRAKRVDFVAGTDNLYKAEAVPGSLDSEPVWRIRFIEFTGDEDDFSEKWAGGTDTFDKVWDDRLTLEYV